MKPLLLSLLLLSSAAAQDAVPPPTQAGVRSSRIWTLEELKKERSRLDGQVVRLRIERDKLKSPGRNTSGTAFYTAETTRLLLGEPVARALPALLKDASQPATLVLNTRISATGGEWLVAEELVKEVPAMLPEPVNQKAIPFGQAVADAEIYKGKVVKVEFDPSRAASASDAKRYGEHFTYVKHEAEPGQRDSTYVTIRQADSEGFNKVKATKKSSIALFMTKDAKWGWMFVGREWDAVAKTYNW